MPEFVVGSLDIKSLYPSLDIEHSVGVIKQQMIESEVVFDTNVPEMTLHLAATMTQHEIDNTGLSHVVHKCRYKMGPRPSIVSHSVTGTEQERLEADSWLDPECIPTLEENKLMFATVVSNAVRLVMKSHIYSNSDVIRLQSKGGAIGLWSTGEVANLGMLKHDVILTDRLIQAGVSELKTNPDMSMMRTLC